MEFDFSCECENSISGFTRNNSHETSFQVVCDECGATYAVTVTRISEGE